MTKKELQVISEEVAYISERLKILSPSNSIESKQIRRLLHRLDFLEYKIDCFLLSKKKISPLRLISSS